MIRIAKLPYIIENTDRWGRPLGTFSVVDVQGDINEDTWTKIQEYEGYYLLEGAKRDEVIMKAYLEGTNLENLNVWQLPNLPNLTRVIGYASSLVWQFNLKVKDEDDESIYIRSYAIFGEITLYPWTIEHDEKVKFLKKQTITMNSK